MQQHPTLSGTQPSPEGRTALQGLSPNTWGAKALLQEALYIPATKSTIEGMVKYPLAQDKPPIDVIIIPKDFGKRGLKGGGIDHQNKFRWTIVPDAYSTVTSNILQQDETAVDEETETRFAWRVTEDAKEEQGELFIGQGELTSEEFLFGEKATRISEALEVNVDVATRLADPRMKAMLYASLVLDLEALGYEPTFIEGSSKEAQEIKKHYIFIPLGVPARDLKDEKTIKAAERLKGSIRVEQHNVQTGKTAIWHIQIVAVVVDAQPKGTLYAATRTLEGRAATSKKLITVIDIGGGDTYQYEIDLQGGLTANPKRLGNGTIDIANFLVEIVERDYGITLSTIEAQEALYRQTIWKGGEEINIATLIEETKPRWANLLTKITITDRMLSTYIIFTGGGAALFAKELKAKIVTRAKALEGSDFLIMPAGIAAVANCIGLYAIGFYKIQARIRRFVEAYVDLLQERQTIEQESRSVQGGSQSRWEEDRRRFNQLQTSYQEVNAQLQTHVGGHYPEIQLKVTEQRKRKQAALQEAATQ